MTPSQRRITLGSPPRERLAYTGGGSGLYEPIQLGEGQRSRPIVLQDTRRTIDQFTWRKLLAFARQLHANCGEIRGPVMEKAILANSGNWLPRHVGKLTDKKVRNQYEEWAWNWMKSCDIRGQPYDFWTDMYLASIMLDRDGEACFIPTKDAAGNPRLQWVANHRIYSHWNVMQVTEPGPYFGMKFNNGVVYNDTSTPVAYYILEESLQYAQAIKGVFVPAMNICVQYNPDWCDQGRGVTAYAHGIKRIFDTDDIHGYLLLGIKRDAALNIIRSSRTGRVDRAAEYIKSWMSNSGGAITVEELQGGGISDVMIAQSGEQKSEYVIAPVQNPRAESQEYIESIYIGVYQGLGWPYEFSRISKEARGANIRVTVEKVNRAVNRQFNALEKLAVRGLGYGLGTAVDRGELPPGEWWAWEFPMPPEMTADKYHEFQENRENYKMGLDAIQLQCARRGLHWRDDLREMRDEDMRDKFTRVRQLASEFPELTFREVLDLYETRSANPQSLAATAKTEDDDGDEDTTGPKSKTKKPKGD